MQSQGQNKSKKLITIRRYIIMVIIPFFALLLLITYYSYTEVQKLKDESALLSESAYPRILNIKQTLFNVELLKFNFERIRDDNVISQVRNYYFEINKAINNLKGHSSVDYDQYLDNLSYYARDLFCQLYDLLRQEVNLQAMLKDSVELNAKIKLTLGIENPLSEIRVINDKESATAVLKVYSLLDDLNRILIINKSLCEDSNAKNYLANECSLNESRIEHYKKIIDLVTQIDLKINAIKQQIDSTFSMLNSCYSSDDMLLINRDIKVIATISSNSLFLSFVVVFVVFLGFILYYFLLARSIINPLRAINKFIAYYQENRYFKKDLPKNNIYEMHVILEFFNTLFEDIKYSKNESQSLKSDYDKLLLISQRDELTSAYNRRALNLYIDSIKQVPSDFAVLMIDIDFFKKLNDSLGHQYGDKVLRAISLTLINSVASSDYVYRYGGEEFCICLHKVNPENVLNVAEKLCDSVRNLNLARSKESQDIVTISVGVSAVTNSIGQYDFNDMIYMADKALYYAKEHGRNQAILYSSIKETDKEDSQES